MLSDITRDGVLAAIREFDQIGREAFLAKYGFREARSYYLVHDRKRYDSKAIVGAAHGYDRPDLGALSSADFSGGLATVDARLTQLGFTVESDSLNRAPAVWWVNQGKTYEAERAGGYIWAPEHTKGGVRAAHHQAVRRVQPGDLIVHYSVGAIRAIGRAVSAGHAAERPGELPADEWGRAGLRADVEYHRLASPIALTELDGTVRAGSGGPFNTTGGVNQGYLYPLPDRVRNHLMSNFSQRLPIPLGDTRQPHLIAVYVGQTSLPNFHFSNQDGVWGWKDWQDAYATVNPGDLIVFGVGFTGGSPRVQQDQFRQFRFEQLVVGTVRSAIHESDRAFWPDEQAGVVYPWRVEFEFVEERRDLAIDSLDGTYGGDVAEAFRLSATGGGKGVVVPIDATGVVPTPPFHVLGFDDVIADLAAAVSQSGLKYPERLIRDVVTSLATKRFLILTGLSGSGKTRIAQALGEWFGQHAIVAVRPDWTSPDALLGYENGLSTANQHGHAWHVPAALEFMLQAHHDADRPYLLLLDEMNLAHVERYFADVLSGIESNHPVLPNLTQTSGQWRRAETGARLVPLPQNLFIVGTVNIDETTYMFSPKVLDRANTIEFRVSTDDLVAAATPITAVDAGSANAVRSFLEIARTHGGVAAADEQMQTWLRQLHTLLTPHDREFGHRVFQEILRFTQLYEAAGETDPLHALDVQVLQKVLPKFHGSIRELEAPLNALGQWAFHGPDADVLGDFDPGSPPPGAPALDLTFSKVQRMARRLRANHFVSFAE